MTLLDRLKQLFRGSKSEPAVPVFKRHPLDGTTDEAAYRAALTAVLDGESAGAEAALKGVFGHLPDKAKALSIMVHPSQDPDGLFSVLVHLDGPDLHVLNKAIDAHRTLVETRITPHGTVPLLPLFDPSQTAFSVNDAIVDVAADWLETVWQDAGGASVSLPAAIYGEDGYGPSTPRSLNGSG